MRIPNLVSPNSGVHIISQCCNGMTPHHVETKVDYERRLEHLEVHLVNFLPENKATCFGVLDQSLGHPDYLIYKGTSTIYRDI